MPARQHYNPAHSYRQFGERNGWKIYRVHVLADPKQWWYEAHKDDRKYINKVYDSLMRVIRDVERGKR